MASSAPAPLFVGRGVGELPTRTIHRRSSFSSRLHPRATTSSSPSQFHCARVNERLQKHGAHVTFKLLSASSSSVAWESSNRGAQSRRWMAMVMGKEGRGCAKLLRRKTRSWSVRAVLDKTHDVQGSGNGPVDPARLALERLYVQAQQHEGRVIGTRYIDKDVEIRHVASELEVDLNVALEALCIKEKSLLAAEAAVKADHRQLLEARSALMLREQDLESSQREHMRQKQELDQSQQELAFQKEEVERIRVMLWEREGEVRSAQEQLVWKQEEMDGMRLRLAEREKVIESVQEKLHAKERELERVSSELATGAACMNDLRVELEAKEKELALTNEHLILKAAKLQETEELLKLRSAAWVVAQNELKDLEKEVMRERSMGSGSRQELEQTYKLLADVRRELDISRDMVAQGREQVKGQGVMMKQRDQQLVRQRGLLRIENGELTKVRMELAKERGRLRTAMNEITARNEELREKQLGVQLVQDELDRERMMLKEAVAELRELRSELRKRDAALCEAQITVQIREAELIAIKLELRQLRVDVATSRSTVAEKEKEMHKAWKMEQDLKAELVRVKSKLKRREEQLACVTNVLRVTEEEMHSVRKDLDEHKVRLLEASSAVRSVSELSHMLMESATRGSQDNTDLDASEEEQLLAQKNEELYRARRAVFSRGMEVKMLKEKEKKREEEKEKAVARLVEAEDLILERDVELAGARVRAAQSNKELQQIARRWKKRERDLVRAREEVSSTAVELAEKHEAVMRGMSLSKATARPSSAGRDTGNGGEKGVKGRWSERSRLDMEITRNEIQSALNMLQEGGEFLGKGDVRRRKPTAADDSHVTDAATKQESSLRSEVESCEKNDADEERKTVSHAAAEVGRRATTDKEVTDRVVNGGGHAELASMNDFADGFDWSQVQEMALGGNKEGVEMTTMAMASLSRLSEKLIKEANADLQEYSTD